METSRFGNFGLIIANSHTELGMRVAKHLGVTPFEIESKFFDNGELDDKNK